MVADFSSKPIATDMDSSLPPLGGVVGIPPKPAPVIAGLDVNVTPKPQVQSQPQPYPQNPPPPPSNVAMPVRPGQLPVSPAAPGPFSSQGKPQPNIGVPVAGLPKPKKSFPKLVLIIPVLILVLAGIIFGIYKFIPNLLGRGTAGSGAITWWGLWEDDSVVAPLIAEYEKKNPGVKITYVKSSQKDYRERLTNSLARGEGPDIFRIHNTWIPMYKNSLDPLPSEIMSVSDFSKTYYPVIVSDLTYGTGIVGMPLYYDGLLLYINEDLFAKAGKTPPVTWDDLKNTACQLTTVVNGVVDQAGVAMGVTGNVDHWQEIIGLMMIQNGVNLAKPTGNLAEDVLSYYTQFGKVAACQGVGKVWDATLPPSSVYFASGKLAMYFGPSWRAFDFKHQNPNLRFRTVALPQLPKITPTDPNYAYSTYWVEGVWNKSKNKSAAWNFLKFLSSKESLSKMYENSVKVDPKVRIFGEPYPRMDMADLLTGSSILGYLVSQAPDARSWYLASRTWDGPTGINSQINKYFEDAVNAVANGTKPTKPLETVAAGVKQVLGQYGIAVR